jgi:hypothetical protein
MLKRYVSLFAIAMLCALATLARAQTTPNNAAADTTNVSRINYIKQKFTEINANLKSYKKTDQDIEGESTEGGGIVKYDNGKTVVKMMVEFYGEMGKLTEEYYYDSGRLMFYHSAKTNYDMPFYEKGYKVKSVIETRYYFSGNRIVKYICQPAMNLSNIQLEKLATEILKESVKRLRSKG